MQVYTLIVNPTSGRGVALKRLREIEEILKQRSLEYRNEQASKPMDAARIAREAAAHRPEGIIAVGGDGTLFEIINGMIGSDVPLLFASCGTGNDFVRTLKLPKDPVEALLQQLDAPTSRIDVGRMNDYYFLNVAGTGFDVEVLRNAEKYKERYTGLRTYLFGLFDAIRDFRPMTAHVSFDDGPEEEVSFSILSIGNGRYIGSPPTSRALNCFPVHCAYGYRASMLRASLRKPIQHKQPNKSGLPRLCVFMEVLVFVVL